MGLCPKTIVQYHNTFSMKISEKRLRKEDKMKNLFGSIVSCGAFANGNIDCTCQSYTESCPCQSYEDADQCNPDDD